MIRYWSTIFGLDCERSIWVEHEDLGKEKITKHKNKKYGVKIPHAIDNKVTLRPRGPGRTKDSKIGDLLLHVWLNRGEDIRKSLWISETSARNGADKRLQLEQKKIRIVIPEKGYDGLVIRPRGLGRNPRFRWRTLFLPRRRGNLLVKLCVYPDSITPNYQSFDMLTTNDMALEGWVYRKIDDIPHKMGRSTFLINPIQADAVADLFNEHGLRAIFYALVGHLKLDHLDIRLTESDSISSPGNCQRTLTSHSSTPMACSYVITINEQFLDNPFSIAAILAHELCHVVYNERIEDKPESGTYILGTEQELLEIERTVELLVFMFKIGEFQLRVSRDRQLTLRHFN